MMRLSLSAMLAIAPALFATVHGCANDRTSSTGTGAFPDDAVRIAIQPIEAVSGAYTGIVDPRRTLIRTAQEWDAFWRELTTDQLTPLDPPPIDFERQMVIVAAMGSQPTGGYTIAIESVFAIKDEIYVEVAKTSPGPGCMTTQALTAPVAAVTVEKSDAVVLFMERSETLGCE